MQTDVKGYLVPQAKNDWIVDVVVAAGTVFVSLQDRRGYSNAAVNVEKPEERFWIDFPFPHSVPSEIPVLLGVTIFCQLLSELS